MKKITIIILACLFSMSGFAQLYQIKGNQTKQKVKDSPTEVITKQVTNTTIVTQEAFSTMKTKEYPKFYPVSSNSDKSSKVTIWSDDFSVPANWTISNGAGNTDNWVIGTDGGQGTYTIGPITSTTAANGFALFDSDFMCSGNQIGYITTASSINLSAYPGVAIEFESYYREWYSDAFVSVSINGTTWTDFPLYASYTNNQITSNPSLENINISTIAGNQATVWIRFKFSSPSAIYGTNAGCGYSWMVDDVKLIESYDNEMVLDNIYPVFSGAGFYSYTPASQVMDVNFGADVTNNGNFAQTNVYLNVDINDGVASVYNEVGTAVPSIAPAASDSLGLPTAFTTPADLALYETVFSVHQDQTDNNPSNNNDTIYFLTSDTIFGRDYYYSVLASPQLWGGADGDFIGTCFWVSNDAVVNTISVFINSNTIPGTSIIAKLYDGANTEVISSDPYIITAGDLENFVTISFNKDGASEFILGGDLYTAGVECYWGTDDLYFGADNLGPHDYMNSTRLRLGASWYYISRVPMIRLNICNLELSLANLTDISCYAGSDGAIDISVTGGTGVYTYNWSEGSTTQDINNLTAGDYIVTVTDANTCSVAGLVTVTEPAQLLISETVWTDDFSVPANWTISNNVGNNDDWVIGTTPPTGTFAIDTINSTTQSNNFALFDSDLLCSSNQDADLTTANPIDLSQYDNVYLRFEQFFRRWYDSTFVYVSNNGTIWTKFPVNETLIQGSSSYNIGGNPEIVVIDISSIAANQPQVWVRFNFWSPAGAFGGNEGCGYAWMLDDVSVYSTGIFNSTDVSCFNGNDGAIDISVTGGTPSYSYSWSDGNSTEDIAALTAGIYTVTVTDSNGCTAVDSTEITEPAALILTCIGNDVSCNGFTDGSANLTVSGGTSPYTFIWSNGATTEDLTGISANAYIVTATDANNCSATNTVLITEPPVLLTSITGTDVTCNGLNNGAADLAVTGGTPFSLGSKGLIISEILANPTGTDSPYEFVELIATKDIDFSVTPYTIIWCNNGTATDNGWVAGGGLSYAFAITSGTVALGDVVYVGGSSMTPTGIKLRVIDTGVSGGDGGIGNANSGGVLGNGGANADGVAIFNLPVTDINSSSVPVDAVFFGSGVGTAVVSGGTQGYQLPINDIYPGGKLQDTSFIGPNNVSANYLQANGTYNFQTNTFPAVRTWANSLTFTDNISAVTLEGDQYGYQWSTTETTQDISSLTPNTYYVTVTDANSCIKEDSVVIDQPLVLTSSIVKTDVLCFGGNDGTANLTASGGVTPYSYLWSNTETTEDISSLIAGTYYVTVTDANNCVKEDSIIINQPSALTVSITATDVLCYGGNSGAANLSVSGGIFPYTFLWSNAATTEDLSGLAAGWYYVTIGDANNCGPIEDSVEIQIQQL
ncbi:MAG: SprB repeat-containing protein [Bacteroidia bacterium]|nr:SprB repeat-containing protein [Bacteroidia bacterium]